MQLRSQLGTVTVQLHELQDGDEKYVSVVGPRSDSLFEKVLGIVIYEMAAHSDNLMVDRVS